MEILPENKVGPYFKDEDLSAAQVKAWNLLRDLAAQIRPGMKEIDATEIYKTLQIESEALSYWHPPKIRFGKNTLCSFREVSDPEIVLQPDDIFFLDLGPIYDGYEGDVGKTFSIGQYEISAAIIKSSKDIFSQVRQKFLNEGISGAELYAFAEELAAMAGYELVGNGAMGHRVSEFPHAVHHRGTLRAFDRQPLPGRWILEIQLRDQANQIGAFFEDIL